MDNTTNQPETVGQQEPLIDILYKDDYRVKSYIAQMLAGAVQSVKKQSTSNTGSFFDAKSRPQPDIFTTAAIMPIPLRRS